MDSQKSAQDVLRCNLCETPIPPLFCDLCHINLCRSCAGDHLLDESKEHKVVPIRQKWCPIFSHPKCREHYDKQCELYCKQCDTPVCSLCVSAKDHKTHDLIEILKHFENLKKIIFQDIKELKKSIYPKYAEIVSSITIQKDHFRKNSQILKAIVNKQGEFWHREIDTIMKNLQSEIDDVELDQLSSFDKEEEKLTTKLNEISQVIEDVSKILDSNDILLFSDYAFKSRLEEFRKLPPQLKLSLPSFFPGRINRGHLQEEFGSLSKPSMTKEERVYTMDQPSNKSFLDDPQVIKSINTDYYQLYAVTCLTDEEIWTSGSDDIIKLYDSFKGILQKSVQTFSGNIPSDIAVTESGDLLYTDYNDRSVNIAKEDKIQPLVRLEEWRPQSVCNSSSGDMLVIMTSDDIKETKLVRFSGSKEKQSIQWDDRRQPIFSSGNQMYLCENRNLDICVVDCGAHVVLAVNAEGIRFRYTGHLSSTKGWFCPAGITTDSLGKILTSDSDNDCIHILDEDGTFLRYIDSCDLQGPQGLCMDSKDHVFVADSKSGTVKKIQYYM